ncbi:hydroxymethylglutaryl-CoA lyase, partial [Bacillus sp. MBGLi97]
SVINIIERFTTLNCDKINITNTIGVNTPKHTRKVLATITRVFPREHLSNHFHNTYSQTLANIYTTLFKEIEIFHTSITNLNNYPYT